MNNEKISTLSIYHFIILSLIPEAKMAITDSTTPQTKTGGTPEKTKPEVIPVPEKPVSEKIAPEKKAPEKKAEELDLSVNIPAAEETKTDKERLKEEDILAQKKEISPNEAVPEATKIEVEKELPAKMSIQKDQKIIKELEKPEHIISAKEAKPAEAPIPSVTPAEETKPVETSMPSTPPEETKPKETVETTQTPETPAGQPATMNLDSLLEEAPTPPTAQVAESEKMMGFPPMPTEAIAKSPATTEMPAKTETPAAVTKTEATKPIAHAASKNKWVKILLFVVLFAALGFTTYFIITTMYPMGIFNAGTWSQDIITETPLLTWEETLPEEIIAAETGTEMDTGHAGAEETFEDFETLLESEEEEVTTPTFDIETLVIQLNNYQDRGTSYLQVAKAQNDLQSMKRALYLSRKAPDLLNKIVANANAIDSMQEEITEYMTNFETFLQKLKDKYGEITTSSSTQTTETGEEFIEEIPSQ